MAGAVNALFELGLSRPELVAVARSAENDFVGAPTGGMDQLASVFGERDRVLLCDMRSLQVEPVEFDLAAAGLTLLVTDTRAAHQLTDGRYGERRADCEAAARELGVTALRDLTLEDLPALDRLGSDRVRRRARHVITENDRTLACAELLRTGQLRQIGPLLTASHASMRDDLREQRARSGTRGRGDARLRGLRRPDDRRRLRWLRDRAVRPGAGPGGPGRHRRCVRRPRLPGTGQLRGQRVGRAAPRPTGQSD